MHPTQAEVLIEAVNQELDPVALLNHIGFLAEKKVLSGSTLRAACPIHRDEEFLTLFVNTRKKTFRCSVNTCRGCEGGSLVRLYGLVKGRTEAQAARDLVKFFSLSIDTTAFDQAARSLYREAEQAFIRSEHERALEYLAQVLAIDPQYLAALTLQARVYASRGEKEQVCTSILQAARYLRDHNNTMEAIRLLHDYVDDGFISDEVFDALANLHIEVGEIEEGLAVLQQQLSALAPSNMQEAVVIIEQMVAIKPDDRQRRQDLAQALAHMNDVENAINHYMELASQAEADRQPVETLRHLDAALRLNPQLIRALEWKSRLFLQSGDKQACMDVLQQLARLAEERRDLLEARRLLAGVRELSPRRIDTLVALARLDAMTGEPVQAAGLHLDAATLLLEGERRHEAVEQCAMARRLAPADQKLMVRAGQLLWKAGQPEQAFEVLIEAASFLSSRRDRDGALEVYRIILELFDDDLGVREHVAENMELAGLQKAANQERGELARLYFAAGADDKVLEMVNAALRKPGDLDVTPYHKYRVEALRRLDRPAERDEAILEYARALGSSKRANAVERLLVDALSIDHSTRIFQEVMDMYTRRGDYAEARGIFENHHGWVEEESLGLTLGMARRLREHLPEDDALGETLARLLVASDNADQAREIWQQLLERYHLRGNIEGCRRALAALQRLSPGDPILTTEALVLDAETQQPGTGERLLEFLSARGTELDGGLVENLDEAARLVGNADPDFLSRYLRALCAMPAERVEAPVRRVALRRSELANDDSRADAIADLRHALEILPGDLSIERQLMRLLAAAPADESRQEACDLFTKLDAAMQQPADRAKRRDHVREGLKLFAGDMKVLATWVDLFDPASDDRRQHAENIRLLIEDARQRDDHQAESDYLSRLLSAAPQTMPLEEIQRLADLALEKGDRKGHMDFSLHWVSAVLEADHIEWAVSKCEELVKAYPQEAAPRQKLVEIYRLNHKRGELAVELIGLGDLAVARRELSRAELYFREAEEIQPNDPEVMERLAALAEERGLNDAALAEYRRLADLMRATGDAAGALRITEHMARLDPASQAIKGMLATALSGAGQKARAAALHTELAEAAANERRHHELSRHAEQALSMAPDDADLPARLAELFLRTEQLEQAIRFLLISGRRHATAGHHGRGSEMAQRVLRLHPEHAEGQALLAEMQRAQGETTEALESLRSLAGSHAAAGRWADAASVYREIVALDPADQSARTDLAECLTQAGRSEEANITLRDLCLSLDPTNAEQAQTVESVARRVIDSGITDVELRSALAQAYRTLGKAMPELDQHARMAASFLQLGREADARASLERMKELRPDAIETIMTEARLASSERPGDLADIWHDAFRTIRKKAEGTKLRRLLIDLIPDETLPMAVRVEAAVVLDRDMGDAPIEPDLSLSRLVDEAIASGQAKSAFQALSAMADDTYSPGIRYLRQRARLQEAIGQQAGAAMDMALVGNMLAGRKQEAEALEAYIAAERLGANDPEFIIRAASIAEHLNRMELAIEWLRRAERLMREAKAPATERIPLLEKLHDFVPEDEPVEEALLTCYREAGQARRAAELLLMRAEVAQSEGDLRNAERQLRTAVRLDAEFYRVRRVLAEVLSKQGRITEAREELLLLARELDRAGNHALALQVFTRARDLDVDCAEAHLQLADFYGRMSNRNQAAESYEKGIGLLLNNGDIDRAIEVLEHAGEVCGEVLSVQQSIFQVLLALNRATDASQQGIRLARFYLRRGEEAPARTLIDKVVHLPRRPPALYESVAELYREFEHYDDAAQAYLQAIKAHMAQERFDAAIEVAQSALTLRKHEELILRLMLECLTHLGPEREADTRHLRVRLAEVLGRNEDLADITESLRLYEEALAHDPGNLDLARAMMTVAVRSGDRRATTDRLLEMAARLTTTNHATAVLILERAAEGWPRELRLLEALLNLHQKRGEVENARAVMLRIAEAHGAAGDSAREESMLMQILSGDPDNISALRQMIDIARRSQDASRQWQYGFKLAMLYEAMDQTAEARRIFEEAVLLDGNNLEAWDCLARLTEREGDTAAQARMLRNLARAQEHRGQRDESLSTWQRLLNLRPDDFDAALEAAELAVTMGRADQGARMLESALSQSTETAAPETPEVVEEVCRRLLSVRPGSIPTRRRLARILESTGRAYEAAEEWAMIASTLRSAGDHDAALEAMRHQARLHPEVASVVRLARQLMQNGQMGHAREILQHGIEAAERLGQFDTALELALESADLLGDVGAHAQAAALASQAGNNHLQARHLGIMGRLFLDSGDHQQAEMILEEIQALDIESLDEPLLRLRLNCRAEGADPQPQLDEGRRLLQRALQAEDYDAACEILEELKGIAPSDTNLRMALIRIHEAAGHREAALAERRIMFEMHMIFGDAAPALEVARPLIRHEALDASDVLAMATQLDEAGHHPEAVEFLLDAVDYLANLSGGDLHTDARVGSLLHGILAIHPREPRALEMLLTLEGADPATTMGAETRERQARQSLEAGDFDAGLVLVEEVLEHQPQRATALELRARIHEAKGNLPAACNDWRAAMAAYEQHDLPEQAHAACEHLLKLEPDDLDTSIRRLQLASLFLPADGLSSDFLDLGRRCMESARFDDARTVLQLAQELLPTDARTQHLRLMLVASNGETTEAARAGRDLAASLLADNRLNDARLLLEDLLSFDTDNIDLLLGLANVLQKAGDQPGTAVLLHRVLPGLAERNDPRTLDVARRLLKLEPSNLDHHQWLVDQLFSMSQRTEAVALGLKLGDQWMMRQEYTRAEATYRAVLEQDPLALAVLERLLTLKRQTATAEDVAYECYEQSQHLLKHAPEVSNPGQLREMARKLLASALKRVSDSPLYFEAWIEARTDQLTPEELAGERLHLINLLLAEGRIEDARVQLAEAMRILGHHHPDIENTEALIQQHSSLLPPVSENDTPPPDDDLPGETMVERAEAVENFLKVLQLDPRNIEVHLALALTYQQMENPTGELVHFREVLKLMAEQGRWEDRLEILQGLVERFPRQSDLADDLRDTRIKVRALSLLDAEDTQTMMEKDER